MKKILFSLTVLFFINSAFSQTKEQIEILDKYYQKTLDEWHIPGMAIAITTGDSIIFSKGYGYANLEKKTKVDGNTLFAIASNSKAFTSTSIAQLVEQKKLNWSDKAISHLPYYKLYNDYTTQNETVEDLLSHRNGLVTFGGDLLWYATTKTPEEIISAQQYLKPKYDFRTHFGYSNIGFLSAGKVLEKVTDTTWATYVSTHFLKPLKMNRTLTSTDQIKKTNNIATPYFYENGKHNELKWVNWDNIAPAGALISSVNDYSKWLQLNLNQGTLNGKTYYSKKTYNKLTSAHVNLNVNPNDEKVHFKAYGLGWAIQDYQGFKIIGHGGGYDGMISKSTFVPEKNIGIIILTNSLSWAPGALMYKTLDVLLANKLDGKDWSANYLKYKVKQDSTAVSGFAKNEALRGQLNSKPLAYKDYNGTYSDKIYGDVIVSNKNGKLNFEMMDTPIFKAELKHWNHHIFTFRFDKNLSSLPQGKLWFDLDKNGKVEKLHIDVPNPDFYFTEFEFIKNK
ncbi:MAG: serine hydrolase [Flavobacteriaceae bacterium]|nr:serine hydrolase [Flavobacteriaceae bacterium]